MKVKSLHAFTGANVSRAQLEGALLWEDTYDSDACPLLEV